MTKSSPRTGVLLISTFTISIRLNLRPETAGPVIDALAPVLKEAGLSFRNSVPGLIEGRGISAPGLALLLDQIASLSLTSDSAADAVAAGLIDDLWVHIRRE